MKMQVPCNCQGSADNVQPIRGEDSTQQKSSLQSTKQPQVAKDRSRIERKRHEDTFQCMSSTSPSIGELVAGWRLGMLW